MPVLSSSSVGYPEIKYWTDEYLCKQISAINKASLCNVVFYNSLTDKEVNFEYLFNSDSDVTHGDPLQMSLFNVQTLKQLIAVGDASINIIENKKTTYGHAIFD